MLDAMPGRVAEEGVGANPRSRPAVRDGETCSRQLAEGSHAKLYPGVVP